MSENTATPQAQVETTSVFRADLLKEMENLSLIHISEPTRRHHVSRMPSSA